jgi:arginine/lysine/ornithine decarboxylase
MTIRNAIYSKCTEIPIEKANGKICGTPTVSCPPAIPIVMSGEEIGENAIDLMLYYGIDTIEVVKQ